MVGDPMGAVTDRRALRCRVIVISSPSDTRSRISKRPLRASLSDTDFMPEDSTGMSFHARADLAGGPWSRGITATQATAYLGLS